MSSPTALTFLTKHFVSPRPIRRAAAADEDSLSSVGRTLSASNLSTPRSASPSLTTKAVVPLDFSPLHLALKADPPNSQAVADLLERGESLVARNSLGQTPLQQLIHYIVNHDPNSAERLKMVEILLSKGANANDFEPFGETSLDVACDHEHLQLIALLLKYGAQLKRRSQLLFLWLTLNKSLPSLLSALPTFLQSHPDLELVDKLGQNVLQFVVSLFPSEERAAWLQLIRRLIQAGAKINHTNLAGDTPLHQAYEKMDVDLVKLLLQLGADPCAIDQEGRIPISRALKHERRGELGLTSLEWTILANDKAAAKERPLEKLSSLNLLFSAFSHKPHELLAWLKLYWEQGVKLDAAHKLLQNCKAKLDKTPRHYGHDGIREAWEAVVDFLENVEHHFFSLDESTQRVLITEKKVNPDICDSYGRALLYRTAKAGNLPYAIFLLQHGANPNLADSEGASPLIRAAFQGFLEMVDLLLAQPKLDKEQVDDGEHSPLHYAVRGSHPLVLERLLAAGFDPEKADKFGVTPLFLSLCIPSLDCARILVARGVCLTTLITVKGEESTTMLIAASAKGLTDFVRLLLEAGAPVNQSAGEKNPLAVAANGEIKTLLTQYGALLPAAKKEVPSRPRSHSQTGFIVPQTRARSSTLNTSTAKAAAAAAAASIPK